jgi:H+-translocating NAD(P) transhydrogenase subunit beta
VENLYALAYLVAVILFIIGLMRMSSPKTARLGNLLSAVGMLIAIVATVLQQQVMNYTMVLVGLAIGAIVGGVTARMIKMIQMPQWVGMYNGLGGLASLLIAIAEFFRLSNIDAFTTIDSVTIVITILIGSITLAGSLIAYAKLEGLLPAKPITYKMQNLWNLIIFVVILALMIYLIFVPNVIMMIVLVLVTLIIGVLLVIPIGGADMPVVISLLNSYSGMAGCAAGFVLGDMFLIISGALVGAAGLILTQVMCKAMNRSLTNVMFGAFGAVVHAPGAGGAGAEKVAREATVEDIGTILGYAKSVIFVPGYGLATAQAQHLVKELANMLEAKGVDVKYAIHPVAGRMPGHMNVLLAEADVPYDKLYDLDSINNEFERADAAVVIGANDVLNPVARDVKDSPLYGMPILNVDKAKSVIIIKRSLAPGFAGIDNPIFYMDKTMMFFRDAKKGLAEIVEEVKSL